METYSLFINGSFEPAGSGNAIEVVNPATEKIFATAPHATVEQVNKAVAAAKKAQKKWAAYTAVQRAEHLYNLAAVLKEKAPEIGRIITAEQGKQLSVATGEASWGADLMTYHAQWARRIEGEIIPSDAPNENILLYKEPLGVVACILPWNFPIYVLIRKLSPALITGNTVVLKPSSLTPCSALAFARLVQEAGLPEGVVNIVTGDGATIGEALAAHPDVDFVTVTGSTAAGRRIMAACADNITKVSLELGGKAPAVVMPDADLDLAVSCIKNGRIANAGQVCNCVERVYVHASLADAFVDRMTTEMKSLRLGPGDQEPDMGPLVSAQARDNVDAMVRGAVDDGARLVSGGKKPDKLPRGYYYEPTILIDCRQEMPIMREEIFGPVMPIMAFNSEREALLLANDCKYGLTASLYTQNYDTALRFSNQIEFGELYINRTQGEAYQGFHAGWKRSGIGGDDGKHGMQAYLKTRVVYMSYR